MLSKLLAIDKAKLAAIGVIAAFILWLGSGMIFRDDKLAPTRPSPTASGAPEAATTVKILRSAAQPFQSGVILQGRTTASRSVDLRSEVSGRVERILLDRG